MPRFADIRGQDRALELLRLAVAKDRLHHAYLFHGVRGVGKTTTAIALAQFLNCEQPTDVDSCGDCRSCRRIDRFQHPDVHWIFPMAGSERGQKLKGNERVDAIRAVMEERLGPGIHGLSYPGAASIAIGRDEDSRVGSVGELRHRSGYTAVEARYKVFVVSEAERMTREAANSLLKVLEEPPPDNLLVLTAQRPGQLLDTIVSRCQSIRFRDWTEEEIAGFLGEKGGWRFESAPGKRKKEWKQTVPDAGTASLAAALAGGSLTRAEELSREDMVTVRDGAVHFLGLAPGDPELHKWVANLVDELGLLAGKKGTAVENDRRVIELVLDFGLLWYGDLLRAVTGSAVPLANRDRDRDIREQARTLSVEEIRRRITLLEETRAALRGNVYRPLVLYSLIYALAGDKEHAVS